MPISPQEPRPSSADLERQIENLKDEVDALQIHVMKGSGPWYRQVPVLVPLLVSVFALLFSFGTTYVSERRVAQQERHEKRAELRGLIQRLVALPKENFTLNRRYAEDPAAVRFLAPLINSENVVLAKQAVELIKAIPNEVTGHEYWAVGYALASGGLQAESSEILELGLAAANDPVSEVALRRQLATVAFNVGDIEGGRERWQEALDAVREYPGQSSFSIAFSRTITFMNWAQLELSVQACQQARRLIESAKAESPQALQQQVTAQETAITETCGPSK